MSYSKPLSRAKIYLDVYRLRKLLNIPDSVEISFVEAAADPISVYVHLIQTDDSDPFDYETIPGAESAILPGYTFEDKEPTGKFYGLLDIVGAKDLANLPVGSIVEYTEASRTHWVKESNALWTSLAISGRRTLEPKYLDQDKVWRIVYLGLPPT